MKNIIKVFAIFFSFSLLGQKIKIHGTLNTYIDGKVTTPLFGGEVFLKNAGVGDISNDKGLFSIETDIHLPDTILVRASGYYSDTLIIKEAKDHELNIVLFPEFVAEEVVIKARRANSNILRLDPRNVEQLTQGELRKAACCSLSESFETNATVDVSLSDGVSGSKRIQMMGLEGRYIQLQFENIPFMHNLDQPFGLSSIPGTLGIEDEPKVLSSNGVTYAPVICYESVYGGFVAEQCRKGAEAIFVITNDGWWGNSAGHKQHASIARLRAIETRRYVARSANTGISSIINQRGEVIHATEYWTHDAFNATIQLNDEPTFYVTYGDVIGRSFTFVFFLLSALTLVRYLRTFRKSF